MRALIAFLAWVVLAVAAFGQPYTIEKFEVAIDLKKDGSMQVQETIAVTFRTSDRHGIYRTIPIDLPTGRGTSRRLFLSDVQVTDSAGAPYETKIERQGAYLNVRIGSENIVFPRGTHVAYVIKYKARGMLNWFDADKRWAPVAELYWNAIGTDWDTEISAATVTVKFPTSNAKKGLRARVFAGAYGSDGGDTVLGTGVFPGPYSGTEIRLDPQTLTLSHPGPLAPGQGLTFALDVPAAVIEKPTALQQAVDFLLPNLGFLIPFIALALSLFAYLRFGRDPDSGPVVVQFDPPDGLSGAELGTFIDEKVDKRDLVAGILGLAVGGYLTIHPKETGLVFKHRTAKLHLTGKAKEADQPKFERKLLDLLTPAGPVVSDVDLRKHVAPSLATLHGTLMQGLVDRGYYRNQPGTAKGIYVAVGLAVVVLLTVIFAATSPVYNPIPAIVGGVLGAIVVLATMPAMAKRTAAGALALGRAKGFAEFIKRARSEELNWVAEKHPDAALYEKYLPHAMALGLVDEWSRAFDDIVKEMPDWYVAPRSAGFNPVFLGNDLNTIGSNLGSAATTPPRSSGASGGSSGFSGGGFSGGGFGGGGGGSW